MYKKSWEVTVGEELECKREPSNLMDRYAVAVVREGKVTDHLPQKKSFACSVFIRRGYAPLFSFPRQSLVELHGLAHLLTLLLELKFFTKVILVGWVGHREWTLAF